MSSRSGACRTSEPCFLPNGTPSMLALATGTLMRFHISLSVSQQANASSSTPKVFVAMQMQLYAAHMVSSAQLAFVQCDALLQYSTTMPQWR